MSQNYSKEALEFFVRFYHEIGQVGKLRIVATGSNKPHIIWRTESWEAILGNVTKYFSYIYGEKYLAFQKLSTIFELKSSLSSISPPQGTEEKWREATQIEIVKLGYSLASSGTERLISLRSKLESLNLSFNGDSEPDTCYLDNPQVPSFLFILGFLLGDGSLLIRVRLTLTGAFNFIPLLVFPQKKSDSHTHMYTMMSVFFDNMGIKTYIFNSKQGITTLRVEGINAVFPLVPLFKDYMHFGYWRADNINLLLSFFNYHSMGAQTHKEGVVSIFNLLYKYPNVRSRSLSEWIGLVTEYFDGIDAGCVSGYQCIQPSKGRGELANEIIAWRVVLPERLLPRPASIKYFQISTHGSSENALKAAVEYRDHWFKENLKELS